MVERWWESGQMRWLLAPLAPIYRVGLWWRNRLRSAPQRAGVPVISVGNLSVGGAGKTPVVLAILELLQEKRVGVLARGYRRKGRGVQRVDRSSTPEMVGDEPYMIWQRFPEAIVVVGADRVAAAQMAIDAGAELLILDDGFQHRQLERDLDVVVDDGLTDHLFPWGRLREPRSALKRADLIEAPRIEVESIDLAGKRVALFCGIARPERFVRTVEALGAHVQETLFLPDHRSPSLADLEHLSRAGQLVCTEKDWVKLPKTDLSIECVRIRHRLSENLIDQIRSLILS